MKFSELDALAVEHGISLTRPSPEGIEVPVSEEAKQKVLSALGIEPASRPKSAGAVAKPAVKKASRKSIPKSYLPDFLADNRESGSVWGISLQLYELRSPRNWGIGDFADLLAMIDIARSLGADFIGLNPLHAPFLADPDRCSPYEPSNRQMLNPLYIAVDKVPGFNSSVELEARLQELRQIEIVDYVSVAETKISTLRKLWHVWQQPGGDDPAYDPGGFDAFVNQGGEILRNHALFEAISADMSKRDKGTGWRSWPPEFQSVDSPAVSQFARDHADEVRFHIWLQWLADRQLTMAADAADKAGLKVGLYLDLAVGEAIDGSATWSERNAYISDATVGSPPDPFATEGQDWHLAALKPSTIAAGDSPPYRRMVVAAMRYAGAIRIDHAAALKRLFLVPMESRPDGGAYVNYPEDDLLRILAETSNEHQCLVIGEDLGMLPEGLQDDLEVARILSYRILSYERDADGFKPADVYPVLALACISTHDHQTLAGWWRGADIEARAEHGLVPADVTKTHDEERRLERKYLIEAIAATGIEPPKKLPPKTASEEQMEELVIAAHRFIARTPCMLAAVRLADMTSEKKPTNVPGTSDSYPNWKPKLSVALEELAGVPLLKAIAKAMREERPNSG